MAARRLSKSAVDWAAFAERIAPSDKDMFRQFKSHSDKFMTRVHQFPESLPKIDFAYYRAHLANTAMVDQFEKSYAKVAIDYPKDSANLHASIDEDKLEAEKSTREKVASMQESIKEYKLVLSRIGSIPKPKEMTLEMLPYYFPEAALNVDDESKITFFPHEEEKKDDDSEKFIS